MKRTLLIGGMALVLALFGSRAEAEPVSLSLTPATVSGISSTGTASTCTTNDNSELSADVLLEVLQGCWGTVTDDPLELLYKAEVDNGTESGPLASSYKTTFTNTPSDPSDALIDFVSGLSIDCVTATCYLVVKDGNQNPAQYFFDLSALLWDGEGDIKLTGFWPKQGAISHVAIWSTATPVPEPATLLLLGTGLGLAALRQRRRRLA